MREKTPFWANLNFFLSPSLPCLFFSSLSLCPSSLLLFLFLFLSPYTEILFLFPSLLTSLWPSSLVSLSLLYFLLFIFLSSSPLWASSIVSLSLLSFSSLLDILIVSLSLPLSSVCFPSCVCFNLMFYCLVVW